MTNRAKAILLAIIGRAPPRHYAHGRRDNYRENTSHRSAMAAQPRTRNWFVTKEVGAVRVALFITSCFLFGWIAWYFICDTAAMNLSGVLPRVALQWKAAEPAALDRLAFQELARPDGNLDAARQWAQRALRARPMDDNALLALGLIADRQNQKGTANLLAQMAGERSWRNQATQIWLYDLAVRKGNFVDAIPHADAIFRVQPDSQEKFFPALAAFTTVPSAFKALTDFLKTDPPWRDSFLGYLSTGLKNKDLLDEVYADLKDSASPPTTAELRSYWDRLIKDGRFEQAVEIWLTTLPKAEAAKESHPYNGDFSHQPDGSPFDWVLKSETGADSEIVGSDPSGKPALHVQFSGARVDFANVSELMVLRPGRYNFSGKIRADELRTSRGLWWRIFCAEGPHQTIMHTDLVSTSMPLTDFVVEFDVPAERCKAQWLRLESPARIDSEKRIEGEVWYRTLRIVPIAGDKVEQKSDK
jgi:tetratricopeptide (TPR) repeat protein